VRGADLHVDGRVVRRADGSQQRHAGHADHGRKAGRPDVWRRAPGKTATYLKPLRSSIFVSRVQCNQ
jgi:hypothetical protein